MRQANLKARIAVLMLAAEILLMPMVALADTSEIATRFCFNIVGTGVYGSTHGSDLKKCLLRVWAPSGALELNALRQNGFKCSSDKNCVFSTQITIPSLAVFSKNSTVEWKVTLELASTSQLKRMTVQYEKDRPGDETYAKWVSDPSLPRR